MAFLEDIKQLLVDLSLAGGSTAWPLFIGTLPPAPHQAIALFRTGGPAPDTKVGKINRGLQIIVRGPKGDERHGSYPIAESKAEAIVRALDGESDREINGTLYLQMFAESEALFIERDDDGRARFSANFSVWESAN